MAEDGRAAVEDTSTMGAANNSNSARLATLQERKKQIEEALAKRNQELRQLCIQEAELTGITPPEMPLEPGEALPQIRRRVGTAYQLNEALVKNASKDQEIADLELQIQLHNNLAEAALGLANDQNMSKTVKRQHKGEYQKHKSEVQALTQKLNQLKEQKVLAEQIKQKKKPRISESQDDNISINTLGELFPKSDLRNSLRYSKHSNENIDIRYYPSSTRHSYRNSETVYLNDEYYKPDEFVSSGLYRLSLNGYSRYMERHESTNSMPHPHTQSLLMPYNLPYSHNMQQYTMSQHYQKQSPQISPHSSRTSQHSPQMSQHSLQLSSQHSPHLSQHSPHLSQHSPHVSSQNLLQQRSPHKSPNTYNYPSLNQDYKHNLLVEASPTLDARRLEAGQKHYAHSMHGESSYKIYDSSFRNPHQLQPHQQYEHNGMMQGLGGCWKQTENGLVWCMSNSVDNNWQRDKRFGSLDRRKNKRVNKRVSPVDSKSATLATVSSYPEQVRTASIKSSQVKKTMNNRRCHDHRYLVRTQSLGSVGVQAVDSVYQSDDNSSDGDNKSISDRHTRKHKEKEWTETSLDGPGTPPPPITSRLQPTVPTVLAPEEKYLMHSSPPSPKPILEIPAETAPRPPPETNIEVFNNNIPKNCTVVQAGHCKPYHEETKPFEMSDFYKYSTKYKKSPAKQDNDNWNTAGSNVQRNLNESTEAQVARKGSYLEPKYRNSIDSSGNLNASLDLNQAQHFSDEMNTWYNNHEHQLENNANSSVKSRSTATLV